VDNIDLSRYAAGEPRSAWSQLWPSQRASLRRFVHEVEAADTLYAKQGPMIVGKGVVTGPYQFDKRNRIKDLNGVPWQHQRPVKWDPEFRPVRASIGIQQIVTLVPLATDDVKLVEQALRRQQR
jgi:hypothetical protein